MNEIQIFNNPNFGEIRTSLNEKSEPLFCASDVCKALGYSNPRDAVSKHVSEDDVAKCDATDSLGRIQSTSFLNESGLYSLIFGSKLESAKQFKRWVTSEVLPSIRKHGIYATPQTIDDIIANPENAIKLLTTLKEEREQRKIAEAKIAEDAPKVEFHDQIVASDDTCLMRELAKILTQRGFKIGQNRLYELLRNEGILIKSGKDKNDPTQHYVEQGIFEVDVKPWKNPKTGENHIRKTTKVTSKGIKYFLKKFIGKAAVL